MGERRFQKIWDSFCREWRLHPEVCKFTSQLFYENKLGSDELARATVMEGHPWVKGAGMWFVPVEHEGNRSSSAEEVENDCEKLWKGC